MIREHAKTVDDGILGMTRSENPFEDLPEWKERRRLEAASGQRHDAPLPRGYAYAEGHAHGLDATHHAGQQPYGLEPAGGADAPYAAMQQPAGQNGYYDGAGQGAHGYDPLATAHAPGGYGGAGGAPGGAIPYYDPHSQITYPVNHVPTGEHNGAPVGAGYGQPQPFYPNGSSAQHPAPGHENFGFRPSDYGNNAAYPSNSGYLDQAPRTGDYDLSHFAPGQPVANGASGGAYDPNGPASDYWREGQAAMGPAALGAEPGHDEDEYDDEDEAEPRRYSWKLLAAVVVTGAVVTGGGVVLYDSFKSGGLGGGGAVPVIKADQGPAKTSPDEPGGRQFAHRDSKLLGRLDSSREGAASGSVGEEADANRVRSVPTVRIGKDGRLLLPKAPEAVEQPRELASAPNVPGINVVDSLSNGGSASSGTSNLPPVVPKSEPPLASAPAEPTVPIPQARAPQRTAAIARAPVVKNRATASRPRPERPAAAPVSEKSAVGSAWRMTSTRSAAGVQSSGAIQPTIAQPIVVPPAVTASTTSPSTLGAETKAAAAGQARGYVAVLATTKTSVAALQSFAELQQKHPNALSNRVPSVQRADLNARGLGVMYRLVVGPAATRNDANAICNSLKTEGYKGCWVKSN